MINIEDLNITGDEPLQLLLGDADQAELEDVCRKTQAFMADLLKSFTDRHPEMALSVEPIIHVNLIQ